jgi:hypothetical protein
MYDLSGVSVIIGYFGGNCMRNLFILANVIVPWCVPINPVNSMPILKSCFVKTRIQCINKFYAYEG